MRLRRSPSEPRHAAWLRPRPGAIPAGGRRRRLQNLLAAGLAGALAATPALGVTSASAVPAASATVAAAAPTVTVNGHGYGHGRGLGQYGADGYASMFGWNSSQILDHFYGNTSMGSVAGGTQMTVRLLAQDGANLVVTSPTNFSIAGVTIGGGSTGRVARVNGQWTLFTSYGCGQPEVFSMPIGGGSTTLSPEFVPANPNPGFISDQMLALCEGTARHFYRGTLREALDGGALRTVNTLSLDDYVKGVVPQESPSSWPAAALQAQAVAARSYSMAENRYSYAKTCDTTSCQMYRGFSKGGTAYEAASSSNAVAATSNQVRLLNGGVARTEFSSSTGGYSAGGTFPAVPDDGDAISANGNHNWSVTLDSSAVASAFGVGTLTGIQVTARNGLGADGGRVTTVQISGTTKTVSVSGETFRSTFGLRSNWFSFGGQVASLGPPTFYLRDANNTGVASHTVEFGDGGGAPLLCDWNGDGVDTPATVDDGVWTIRNSLAEGFPDAMFAYGLPTDTPVCGDWDGNGTDTPGIVRNGVWYLRNANTAGTADVAFAYGLGTDKPVVGDWDGNHTDTPGVVRNGVWYLRNANTSGVADSSVGYGLSTDKPVAGDWDGNGSDTPGVVRNGIWYLRNNVSTGVADVPAFAYGDPADQRVMAADGDGNGTDGPAIARNFAG